MILFPVQGLPDLWFLHKGKLFICDTHMPMHIYVSIYMDMGNMSGLPGSRWEKKRMLFRTNLECFPHLKGPPKEEGN